MDFLLKPWHWSVAGLIIGLTVPALLILGNKKFGISSSLRHVCAACAPANIPFFQYDWKKEIWNLYFVAGILLGGILAGSLLSDGSPVEIGDSTKAWLQSVGITDYRNLAPSQLFNWDTLFTAKGLILFIGGGFLVGFGTRYAGGCTSGHAIMGISSMQISSVIATICFMIGGFFSANVLLPMIFRLF